MDKEIWKDIEGYEGKYQVSNLGRVRSLVDSNGNKRIKILSYNKHPQGYLKVNLWRDNKVRYKYVHRLVARAFIPNPNSLPQVNHISGVKTENNVQNLEWVSRIENMKHSFSIGLHPRGEKRSYAKFTNEQVKQIRKEYIPHDKNFGLCALARKYGINHSSMKDIIDKKTYKE